MEEVLKQLNELCRDTLLTIWVWYLLRPGRMAGSQDAYRPAYLSSGRSFTRWC